MSSKVQVGLQYYKKYEWGSERVFKSLMHHESDYGAAFDSVIIDWGTSDPFTQPDPAVCTLKMRVRDYSIIENPLNLLGCYIGVFVSVALWSEAKTGSYAAADALTWAQWIEQQEPTDRDWPAEDDISLYYGRIKTGLTVTRRDNKDDWLVTITATDDMALYRRSSKQGITDSAAKWSGYHWVSAPSDKGIKLNDVLALQIKEAAAPQSIHDLYHPVTPIAPWEESEYPNLLTVLEQVTALPTSRPLFYVSFNPYSLATLRGAFNGELDYINALGNVQITDYQGVRKAISGSYGNDPIPASLVAVDDDTLATGDVITGVTIKGYKAGKDSDGRLTFTQMEVTRDLSNFLPETAYDINNRQTIDTRLVLKDESGGLYGGSYTTSEDEYSFLAAFIKELSSRYVPATLTVDSEHIDLDTAFDKWIALYRPQPQGPYIFDDINHAPMTEGPWWMLSGRLTITTKNGHQYVKQEFTPTPGWSSEKQ